MSIKDNIINAFIQSNKNTFELSEIINIIDEVTSYHNLPILESNGVKINPATQKVVVDDKTTLLPKKVFELMYYLIQNKNKVVTRYEILRDIWGTDVIVVETTVTVHIRKVRAIVGKDKLQTIKRTGYAWFEK